MSKPKSHKAMSESDWMSRLRRFASTGVWPSQEGNRPAPRQKKWHELYTKIEKCPRQTPGQRSIFGQTLTCTCGFHTQKVTKASVAAPTSAGHGTAGQQTAPTSAGHGTAGQQTAPTSAGHGTAGQQTAPTSAGHGTAGQQTAPTSAGHGTAGQQTAPTSAGHGTAGQQKRMLSLSEFTKSRFGGSHVSAAKPNLSVARKRSQAPASNPTETGGHTPTSPAVSVQDPLTVAHPPMTELSHTPFSAIVPAPPTRLPRLWTETLPPEDHKWIVRALFKMGPTGKLELRTDLKLWYQPPQPSQLYHQAPAPDRFFAHPLLVWMPYKLWKVKVVCPNPACGRQQLTGAGLHKRARRVLDVDRVYNMVAETLSCSKCKAAHVSWSQTVLTQLDLAHKLEFRVILTKKYACDIRVIRLLRERGLGNSPTRVLKQLKENHTEEWLQRTARYTTECVDFLQSPGLLPMTFPEPPELAVVPSCKWLLSVYSQDILTRLEEIQAGITSIYGTILKLDSTKKITKKLAGTAKGTAVWLTSVGNEYGQILISVLTAQEGSGLDLMAAGLMRRYQRAGVDPPVALYVDCGCCVDAGETKLKARFREWPDLTVRLDIWHFMRRLAVGCTTDAHQLYPIFMSRLSACIFEWDADDLAKLRQAKKQLLGLSLLSDADVDKRLKREELCLHCRRRTHGEETTTQLLEELLRVLMGSSGNDSLGVPLFDRERMEHIWSVQKKHIKCIQDLSNVALYIQTGELSKGGLKLPVYRCARGSTSLESFHLHLNRFIPGTSANSLNFQIYLLEGLHRWNQDRRGAALSSGPSGLRSYSGDLLHSVNKNYERLFGRKVAPEFCPPSPYTGELIGVQYLFRQTGQALQDMNPDSEATAQLLEEHDVEDEVEEDEGFSDTTDPTLLDMDASSRHTSDPSTVTTGVDKPTSSSSLDPGHSTSPAGPSTSLVDTSTPVAAVAGAASPSSSSSSETADEEMAVDDQNIPGYQHVDRLAAFLVELRVQDELFLSHQQATRIIQLWDELDDWDNQRVVYAARHQKRLLSGRFRTPKRPSSIPGVESTTRCMLGASSAPAQTPSCCRLVENIFIRLCTIHPSPKRKGKGAESRWSLILRDYRKIRQLVVGNASVMDGSGIQLVEVNQATLINWHNNRVKDQERAILQQGITLPPALPVASDPLQEARVLPALPEPPLQQHQYQLPQSTAGQAQQRQRAALPKGPVRRELFPKPPAPVPLPPPVHTPAGQPPMIYLLPVPANQGTNIERSLPPLPPLPDPGARSKRAYTRTVIANTCKKCGQFRTAATGHSQYRGTVYCPKAETLSKEEWLCEMRRKHPK